MKETNNNLYIMPENIQTRWASVENPKGMKGKGGQENNGMVSGSVFPYVSRLYPLESGKRYDLFLPLSHTRLCIFS